MKNLFSPNISATAPVPSVSLNQLTSRLITSLLPTAVKRGSLVVNDIPRHLTIEAEEDKLAYVLWNLLSSAVNSTQNQCLRIEAISIAGCTMIRIKHAGVYFYHTISGKYRQVQYVAGMLGGHVSLEHDEHSGSNISLNISNSHLAA